MLIVKQTKLNTLKILGLAIAARSNLQSVEA